MRAHVVVVLAPRRDRRARVTWLGDVNGDGFADMAVAEPGASVRAGEAAGRVSVYRGGASGLGDAPSRVIGDLSRLEYFGKALAQ